MNLVELKREKRKKKVNNEVALVEIWGTKIQKMTFNSIVELNGEKTSKNKQEKKRGSRTSMN